MQALVVRTQCAAWRRTGQRRESAVPFRWEEHAFEAATEAVALIALSEEGIKLLTVGLKWTRGSGNGEASNHGNLS